MGLIVSGLIRVEPVALLPTQAGCAVFLGDGQKVIVFYIDPSIGASINAVLSGAKAPRPLSHDLFNQAIEAFGAQINRVVIVRREDDVFFARLFMTAENEVMERKIVELDARPSDCIALAVRSEAPIYVLDDVWNDVEDMSSILEDLRTQQNGPQGFGV